MAYLDYNATAPMTPEAESAFLAAAREHFANPSSPHRMGARAGVELAAWRERLASILRVDADEIVFTSGATESANAVLRHFGVCGSEAVLFSPVEHPCVRSVAMDLGERAKVLSADPYGRVSVLEIAERMDAGPPPSLVAVMAANNETGVLQPWREVDALCSGRGIPFLCDAVQWLGRLPLGAIGPTTFLLGSAHKFGGPKGVGFLRVPRRVGAFSSLRGGEQEGGRRAGTENLPGIAGMSAALEVAIAAAEDEAKVAARLAWQNAFLEKVAPLGARPATGAAPTLWNTVSLLMPHSSNHRWVNQLSRRGYMVSTGSACATGREAPSHVFAAMGHSDETSRRAIRISSGWATTQAEWEGLAAAFEEVDGALRQSSMGSAVIEIPD